MDRRAFLRVGAAGGAFLAFVRFAHGQKTASHAALFLTAADRDAMVAIVPVMLAGALPATGPAAAAAIDDVVAGVDRAVAGFPLHLQREVRELLALLGFGPARRLLAGIDVPWPEAKPEDIARFLQSWRLSRFALLQQAYLALHDLIIAAWYGQPQSWPAIGYPGPPQVA